MASTADFPFLVDGQWRTSGSPLEIRSPFNGELAGTSYEATPQDVEDAVGAAKRAFAETRDWPTFRRVELLQRIISGLRERHEAIARLMVLEVAKPIRAARLEVQRAIGVFTDALEEAKRLRGEWLPLDLDPAAIGRQGLTRRFPVGPMTAITPFNFPANLVAHKVAPALACGNTVILKPAPQAPLSALMLARVVAEAGAPPGLISVLPCSNAVAHPLVTDERIKLLSFTGSAAVGWELRARAGKKRVVLELGGNAGVIVHSDADLDFAARRCVQGGFGFAGQVCISVQRVYAHRPVFETFTAKVLDLVRQLNLGDPLAESTDLGPMISPREAERAESWVREAVAGGARLLCGGQRQGACLQPTVLTATRPCMKVHAQEVFAPVVVVEPYDELAEAFAAINDSSYGLQAGLFTSNLKSAFAAFTDLEVGGLLINDIPTWRADPMPYGGMKDSGLGREGVRYAIEGMTELKLLVLNLS